MRKSDQIEILTLFLAAGIGIIGYIVPKWYFSLIVYILGFGACSFLVGLLKEATLREYLDKLKEKKE